METIKQEDKIEKVVRDFKEDKPKPCKDIASSKPKSRDQAVAIALRDAGLSRKRNSKK
jgi:hypothetical protein